MMKKNLLKKYRDVSGGWYQLFAVVLLLVCGSVSVGAAQVDAERALSFARGWLSADAKPFGLDSTNRTLSGDVQPVINDEGNVVAHVVSFNEGGYVAIAGDDRMNPVVFVADSGTFDYDPRNPMVAMMVENLTGRIAALNVGEGAAVRSNGEMAAAVAENQDVWNAFASGAAVRSAGSGTRYISEIWVDRFITTNWGQLGEPDKNGVNQAVYNYYTPFVGNDSWRWDYGNVDNIATGCVATGTAQTVAYFRWPRGSVANSKGDFYVVYYDKNADPGRDTVSNIAFRGGNGQGSPYDWDNMEDSPTGSSPLAVRQAIGSLMADAGRAVNMGYNSGRSGESGSNYKLEAWMNQDKFQYGNASHLSNDQAARANLDARRPVPFDISGGHSNSGGHAVLLDGYGRMGDRWYWHINFGWDGNTNVWYCLDDGYSYVDFRLPYNLKGNIYRRTQQANEDIHGGIISGRITDASGNPIPGVTVGIKRAGQTDVCQYMLAWYDPMDPAVTDKYAATIVTDDSGNPALNYGDAKLYRNGTDKYGIFAIDKVPAGSYELVFEKDGLVFEGQKEITLNSARSNCWGNNFVAVSAASGELALDTWYLGSDNNVYLIFNRAVGDVKFSLANNVFVGNTVLSPANFVVQYSANSNVVVLVNVNDMALTGDTLTIANGFAYYDLNTQHKTTSTNYQYLTWKTPINNINISSVVVDDEPAGTEELSKVTAIAICDATGAALANNSTNASALYFRVEGTLDAIDINDFTLHVEDPNGTQDIYNGTLIDGSVVDFDGATGIVTVNVTSGAGRVRLDYIPLDGSKPCLAGEYYMVDIVGPAIKYTELTADGVVTIQWTKNVRGKDVDGNPRALDRSDFLLNFQQNGGNDLQPVISRVDHIVDTHDVVITLSFAKGVVPKGSEKIEIRPYADAVYDVLDNVAAAGTTTGQMLLHHFGNVEVKKAVASYDNLGFQIVFNKRVFGKNKGYEKLQGKKPDGIDAGAETVEYVSNTITAANFASIKVIYEDNTEDTLSISDDDIFSVIHSVYLNVDLTGDESNKLKLDPVAVGKDLKQLRVSLVNIYDWDNDSFAINVDIPLHRMYKAGAGKTQLATLPPPVFTNAENSLSYESVASFINNTPNLFVASCKVYSNGAGNDFVLVEFNREWTDADLASNLNPSCILIDDTALGDGASCGTDQPKVGNRYVWVMSGQVYSDGNIAKPTLSADGFIPGTGVSINTGKSARASAGADRPDDWGQAQPGDAIEYYGAWYRDLDGDGRVDAIDMKIMNPQTNGNSEGMNLIANVETNGFRVLVQNNDPMDKVQEPQNEYNWDVFNEWNQYPLTNDVLISWFDALDDADESCKNLLKDWTVVDVTGIAVLTGENTIRLTIDQSKVIPQTYGERLVMVAYNSVAHFDANGNPQGIYWRWTNNQAEAIGYYFLDSFGPFCAWDGAAPVQLTASTWRATPYPVNDNEGFEYLDVVFSEPVAFVEDHGMEGVGWQIVVGQSLDGPVEGAWGADVIGRNSNTVRFRFLQNAVNEDRSYNFEGILHPMSAGYNVPWRNETDGEVGYDKFRFSGTAVGIRPVFDGRYKVLGPSDSIEMLKFEAGDAYLESLGYSTSTSFTQGVAGAVLKTYAQGGDYIADTLKWNLVNDEFIANDRDLWGYEGVLTSDITASLKLNNESNYKNPGAGVYGGLSSLMLCNTTINAYPEQNHLYGIGTVSVDGEEMVGGEMLPPHPFATFTRNLSTQTTETAVLAGPIYKMVKASAKQLNGSEYRITAGSSITPLGINVAAGSDYKLTAVKVRLYDLSKGQFDPAIDLLPLGDAKASGVELVDAATGNTITVSYDCDDLIAYANGGGWSEWKKNEEGLLYREVTMRPIGGVTVPTSGGEAFSFDYLVRINTSSSLNLGDNFIAEIPDDGILFGADYATIDKVPSTWGTKNGTIGFAFSGSTYRESNWDGIWQPWEPFYNTDDGESNVPLYDGGRPCVSKINFHTLVKPGDNLYNMFYAKKDGACYPNNNRFSWYNGSINPQGIQTPAGVGNENVSFEYVVGYLPGDDVWYEVGGTFGVYDEGIDIPVMGNGQGFVLPFATEEAGSRSTIVSCVANCIVKDVSPEAIAAPSSTPVAVLGVSLKDSGRGFGPRYILDGSVVIETISKEIPYGTYMGGIVFDGTNLIWDNGTPVDMTALAISERAIVEGGNGNFIVVKKLADLPTEASDVTFTISNDDDRDIQQPALITGVRVLTAGYALDKSGDRTGNMADQTYTLRRRGTALSWNDGEFVDVAEGGTFVLNPNRSDYLIVEVTSVGGAIEEALTVYCADGRDILPLLNVSGMEIVAVSDMIKQGYFKFVFNGGSVSWGGGDPVVLNNAIGAYTIVPGVEDGAYIVVKRTAGQLPSSKVEDTLFINQLQLLKRVDVRLNSINGVTASHFMPMSMDETSGVSLWADNDGDGKFSADKDSLIKLLSVPELTGAGTSYTCSFYPDPEDLSAWISGTDDNCNFFICVNTTVDMSYGDQFQVQGQFYQYNPELKNDIRVGGMITKTITCTSVTNTILAKCTKYAQRVDAGEQVPMISIDHFLERDLNKTIRLSELAFTLWDESNYPGNPEIKFDPYTCLADLDEANTGTVDPAKRGIAVFVDVNKNGRIDSQDEAVKYTMEITEETVGGKSKWNVKMLLAASDLLNVPTEASRNYPEVYIVLNMSEDLPFGVSFRATMGADGCIYTSGQGSASASISTDIINSNLASSSGETDNIKNLTSDQQLLVTKVGANVSTGYYTIGMRFDPATGKYYLTWNGYETEVSLTESGIYVIGEGENSIEVSFTPDLNYWEDICLGYTPDGRPDAAMTLGCELTVLDATQHISFWDRNGNGVWDQNPGEEEPLFQDKDGVYTLPWMDYLLDTDYTDTPGRGENFKAVTRFYDAAENSPAEGDDVEAGNYLYYIDVVADAGNRGYAFDEGDIIVVREIPSATTMPALTFDGTMDQIVLDDNANDPATLVGLTLHQFESTDYLRYTAASESYEGYARGSHLYLSFDNEFSSPTYTWDFRVDGQRSIRTYGVACNEPYDQAKYALKDVIGLDLCCNSVEGVKLSSVKVTFTGVANGDFQFIPTKTLCPLSNGATSGVQLWRDADGDGQFNPDYDELMPLKSTPVWTKNGTDNYVTLVPNSGNEITSEKVDGRYDFFIVILPSISANNGLARNSGDMFRVSIASGDISLNVNTTASAAVGTGTMTVDTKMPEVVSAIAEDTDDDARIDTITLVFDEPLAKESIGTDCWDIKDQFGVPFLVTDAAMVDDGNYNTIVLTVDCLAVYTTGPVNVNVNYVGADSAVMDWAGNPWSPAADVVAEDHAAPQILTFHVYDDDKNGNIDRIKVQFSENVDVSTMFTDVSTLLPQFPAKKWFVKMACGCDEPMTAYAAYPGEKRIDDTVVFVFDQDMANLGTGLDYVDIIVEAGETLSDMSGNPLNNGDTCYYGMIPRDRIFDEAAPVLMSVESSAHLQNFVAPFELPADTTWTLTYSENIEGEFTDARDNLADFDYIDGASKELLDLVSATDTVEISGKTIVITFNEAKEFATDSNIYLTVDSTQVTGIHDSQGNFQTDANVMITGLDVIYPVEFLNPAENGQITVAALPVKVDFKSYEPTVSWNLKLFAGHVEADATATALAEISGDQTDFSRLTDDEADFDLSTLAIAGQPAYTLVLSIDEGVGGKDSHEIKIACPFWYLDGEDTTLVTGDVEPFFAGVHYIEPQLSKYLLKAGNSKLTAETDVVLPFVDPTYAAMPVKVVYTINSTDETWTLANGFSFGAKTGTQFPDDAIDLATGDKVSMTVEFCIPGTDVTVVRLESEEYTVVDYLPDFDKPVVGSLVVTDDAYDELQKFDGVYHWEDTENMFAKFTATDAPDYSGVAKYQYRLTSGNTALNDWTAAASASVSRRDYGYVSLDGDKVMVIGGRGIVDGDYQYLTSSEIYDAATDTWTAAAEMSAPRAHMATLVMNFNGNDYVYVFGGRGASYNGGLYQNTVECYDVANNTWTTQSAVMPYALYGATAVRIDDNRAWIVGGQNVDGYMTAIQQATFDDNGVITEIVELSVALSVPRFCASAFTQNDKLGTRVVVLGGLNYDDVKGANADSFIIDLDTDAISNAEISGWNGMVGFAAVQQTESDGTGTEIWVLGGQIEVDGAWELQNATYCLTPGSDAWTAGPAMNVARRELAAVWLPGSSEILVGGGCENVGSTKATDKTEILDFSAGSAKSWTMASNYADGARKEHAMVALGDSGAVMVFCGLLNNQPTATAEIRGGLTIEVPWSKVLDVDMPGSTVEQTINVLNPANFDSGVVLPTLVEGNVYKLCVRILDNGNNESDVLAATPVLITPPIVAEVTSEQINDLNGGKTFYRYGVEFNVGGDNIANYKFSIDGGVNWSEVRDITAPITINDICGNDAFAGGIYSFLVLGSPDGTEWQASATEVAFEVLDAFEYDDVEFVNLDMPEILNNDVISQRPTATFKAVSAYSGIEAINVRLDKIVNSNVDSFTNITTAMDTEFQFTGLVPATDSCIYELYAASIVVRIGPNPTDVQTITVPAEYPGFTWTEYATLAAFNVDNPLFTVSTASKLITFDCHDSQYTEAKVNGGVAFDLTGGVGEFQTGILTPGVTNSFSVEVSGADVSWISAGTLLVNCLQAVFVESDSNVAEFAPIGEGDTLEVEMNIDYMDGLKYAIDDNDVANATAQTESTIELSGLSVGEHKLYVWGTLNGEVQTNPSVATIYVTSGGSNVGSWFTVELAADKTIVENGQNVTFTLDFSDELLIDLKAADLTVVNGTVDSVNKLSATSYEVAVTAVLDLTVSNSGYMKVFLGSSAVNRKSDGWGNRASEEVKVLVHEGNVADFQLEAFAADLDGVVIDTTPATSFGAGDYFLMTIKATTENTLLGAGVKLTYDDSKFVLVLPMTEDGSAIDVAKVISTPYSDGNPVPAEVKVEGNAITMTGQVFDKNSAVDCTSGFVFAQLLFQAIGVDDGTADNFILEPTTAGVSLCELGVLKGGVAESGIAYGSLAIEVIDQPPVLTLTFANDQVVEGEGNQVTVTANYARQVDQNIEWTWNGAAMTDLVIPAGESQVTVDVPAAAIASADILYSDYDYEIVLTDYGVSKSFKVLENDVDGIVLRAIDGMGNTVTSVNGGEEFFLELALPTGVVAGVGGVTAEVTFGGTAAAGTEYILSGDLVIPAGASSCTIKVTTGTVAANYDITAQVTALTCGTNPVSQFAGTEVVSVALNSNAVVPGDFNGDDVVDIDDILYFVMYYSSDPTTLDPSELHFYYEWEEICDLNGDGVVDIDDVLLLVYYYNSTEAVVRAGREITVSLTADKTALQPGDDVTIRVWVKTNVATGVIGANVGIAFEGLTYKGEFNPSSIVKNFTGGGFTPSGTLNAMEGTITKLGGANQQPANPPLGYNEYVLLAEFVMTAEDVENATLSVNNLRGTVVNGDIYVGTATALYDVSELNFTVGVDERLFTAELEVEYDGAAVRTNPLLTFGMNADGSTAANEQGNAGAPIAYNLAFNDSDMEYLTLFKAVGDGPVSWNLTGNIVGDNRDNTNGTVTIRWNQAQFPQYFDFTLVENLPTGIVTTNMKTATSYTFRSATGVIDAVIRVKKHEDAPEPISRTVVMTRGSNLVGVPFVLDAASEAAFRALCPLDDNWQEVRAEDPLVVGKAYWLYVDATVLPDAQGTLSLTLTGNEDATYTGVALNAGWNAVCPAVVEGQTFGDPSSNANISKVWYWTRTGYKVGFAAGEAQGYWVYATAPTTIWTKE